jgi:hypothetical protein
MLNYRVVACALVISTVSGLSACKSKPHATSSEQKPNQVQLASSKAPELSDEKSCQDFVQKFYDWRVSLLGDLFCSHSLKGTLASEEEIHEQEEECRVASAYRNAEKLSLNQVLSPKLVHYLKREDAEQAKEEDAGLDFDPYLNTQDPSPKFVVDSVNVKGNRCDAVVHGYDILGKQREKVMPELSKTNGRWTIENFHYEYDGKDGNPPLNNDLIHMIREYVGEVK